MVEWNWNTDHKIEIFQYKYLKLVLESNVLFPATTGSFKPE